MEVSSNKLKNKPTKFEDLSKEQIRCAIVKKKECDAKAQQIVESLLENGITESYFLQCLSDINQAHIDDIIEERSIIQLCGYPICKNKISEKDIPKQKYRISLKTNKVYDITTRKNFCSNSCYNSAMYVKKQMLTSPLWFREYEIIPQFHILPLKSTGSMGQEIDVSLVNRVQLKSENSAFTSINDFAKASLNDIHSDEHHDISNTITDFDHVKLDPDSLSTEKSQNDRKQSDINTKLQEQLTDIEINESAEKLQSLSMKKKKEPVPNPMNIVGEIVERVENKIDPILLDKVAIGQKEKQPEKVLHKKQPVVTALTIEVEKCLAEWFTLDTLLFLFGGEKVREMVSGKGECIKEYLNNCAKGIFYNANSYDQYQQLCRKLNLLEIEDRRHDLQKLQRETKPLPDYSILQEESKNMQLKVKAFLAGQMDSIKPEPNHLGTNIKDGNITQLPLVDKNAQNALRRRIVSEHLNKVLPDLLRSLGLLTQTISADVRLLVNTLKLKADNIMFKPIQWTLITIVIIKLLSIRDKRLEYLLEQPMAFQHMQLLLLSFKQDGGYLDRLISWLTDIDRLLDTNDIQLTIQ